MTSAERDAQIAEDYKSLSASRLATKYSLSVAQINRIVAKAGVVKGHSPPATEREKIIDESHRVIGQRLYFHRNTEKAHNSVVAAEELGGWSAKKLRNIEQGFSPLTLQDLQAISQYMGLPLTKLLENI